MTGEQWRECPACGAAVERFLPMRSRRPDAVCPGCGALERHRFLAVLLEGLSPHVDTARTVVEVAPSPQTEAVLRRLPAGAYVRIDLDPAADRRSVDVQASVTALPFLDRSVDLAVCFHVLEHVPDDRAAMRELARVLSPGGLALVQVPWRPGHLTDEDPSAGVEERLARFGQADHVRYYGHDFEDRLRDEGVHAVRLVPADVLGPRLLRLWGLIPNEAVWLCRPAGASSADSDEAPYGGAAGALASRISGSLRLGLADQALAGAVHRAQVMSDERDETRRALARAEKEAAHWQQAYERLAAAPPVRAMLLVTRPVRRWLARRP